MPTPPKPSSGASNVETFVVGVGAPARLDLFLLERWPDCSRRAARVVIDSGSVLINGRRGRKGQAVRPGDVVSADRGILLQPLAGQPELRAAILYEDRSLLAVDKPACMPTVALSPGDRGTLANYLLGQHPELASVGDTTFEAGLVHRLDTPTSGVLVAARTRSVWRDLRAAFRSRCVGKLYLALVAGTIERRGEVATPIAHHASRKREMVVCRTADRAHQLRAREAVTRYRPLRHVAGSTLLAVNIPTGVRHQIRVHLSSIGHPIVGDALYGDVGDEEAPRLMLHAARIAFAHPIDGRRIIIRSKLPADFASALRRLA